ncbi:MAG: hypothetical protein AAFZ52_18545, partial [Bacteroidota bacterium]
LDEYAWQDGEDLVYTVLTREDGLYLRHYQLAATGPNLRWTYRDTVTCLGAAAGALSVLNQSPELRPQVVTGGTTKQFVLHYALECGATDVAKNLVVINTDSGTPAVRLQGDAAGLYDAHDLVGLPEDTVQQLLALWQE